MKKKKFISPVTTIQYFTPEAYCVVCDNSKTLYKFTCDAEAWLGLQNSYTLYLDNGDGKFNKNSDTKVGGMARCKEVFEVEESEVKDGFITGNSGIGDLSSHAVKAYQDPSGKWHASTTYTKEVVTERNSS